MRLRRRTLVAAEGLDFELALSAEPGVFCKTDSSIVSEDLMRSSQMVKNSLGFYKTRGDEVPVYCDTPGAKSRIVFRTVAIRVSKTDA